MKRWLLLCLVWLVSVAAQEVTQAPVLTAVQTLTLRTSLQHLQITQLRLQIAQEAFQRAQLESQDLLKGFEKPGYVLQWTPDLERFAYVVKPVVKQE